MSVLGEEQTLPETAIQLTGQGLGAIGDVLGSAVVSGYQALPDVPYGIEEGLGLLGSIPTGGDKTLGQRLGSGLGSIGEAYGEFAQEYPRAARNIEALGNIATFATPVKGGGALVS